MDILLERILLDEGIWPVVAFLVNRETSSRFDGYLLVERVSESEPEASPRLDTFPQALVLPPSPLEHLSLPRVSAFRVFDFMADRAIFAVYRFP